MAIALIKGMDTTAYLTYKYSSFLIFVLGILGNLSVIISIARQRCLLKKNYYFLVLKLSICDLAALIIKFLDHVDIHWIDKPVYYYSTIYCTFSSSYYVFVIAEVAVMLIISVHRFRATVHPLMPDIGRRKLKMICSLAYIVSLIVGFGVSSPKCYVRLNVIYRKLFNLQSVSIHFGPTIFMAVVYYKIGLALVRQRQHMKRVCSYAARSQHIRDRRIFIVCLSTVLCYRIGRLPFSLWYISDIVDEHNLLVKNVWVLCLSMVLNIAGTHSANAILYGILDRKIFVFKKYCMKRQSRNSLQQFR